MSFSNPSLVIIFIFSSLIYGFCFLVVFLFPSKKAKIIFFTENIKIILTTFGVLAAIYGVRSFTAEKQLYLESGWLDSAGKSLRDSFFFEKNYHCDTKFSRTEFSPHNFDEITEQFKEVCNVLTSIQDKFIIMDTETISEKWSETKFRTGCKICQEVKARISKNAAIVDDQLNSLKKVSDMRNRDNLELTLFILSPWLVAIIVALSFFKLHHDKWFKNT